MSIIKYNGQLGNFDYDDKMYSVIKDEDGEYLRYNDTENMTPVIPEGLTDCTNMFIGTSIKEPVFIPEGVTTTKGMYADCKNLTKTSSVPDTVIDQSFMYDGCNNLKEIAPNTFSNNAEDLSCVFANCSKLEKCPSIPLSVKNCDSMCLNCEAMTEFGGFEYDTNDSERNIPKDAAYAFAGCSSLNNNAIEIPPSIMKIEGIFEDCNQVDNELQTDNQTLVVTEADFDDLDTESFKDVYMNISANDEVLSKNTEKNTESSVDEERKRIIIELYNQPQTLSDIIPDSSNIDDIDYF